MNRPIDTASPGAGVVTAVSAYLIWGLSPIYWKSLAQVPPFEILLHRMVWSFVFLLPLLALGENAGAFVKALRTPRVLATLVATTLIVSVNWFLFIYAINTNRILQASLGYYINPLVNVLLGMIFLKERLRRGQVIAVILAGISVTTMTLMVGTFPWIALSLAFTFGFYGLIRKVAPVGALVGLTAETMMLSVPATVYLVFLDVTGSGHFLRVSGRLDLLMMGTALVTALPLLLFTIGARRLHFSTIGFLQYIAPSCTFLLAVLVYGEPLETARLMAFVLIWTALAIYSADAVSQYRGQHRKTAPATDAPSATAPPGRAV